ncbi:nucleotide-diphospho-sugar transferase [Catenaria anguillulae PL171]|uniref:Nucleotide-diphospho-sugar transferase n=1 Tax=Catenaria anguillulae PL171 TaxID=765915 RepID=A0A1Y2I4I4_9FUNG|nr:nucleotide-diphospho-sugar transferase [Catenaria anguillulae PL171]
MDRSDDNLLPTVGSGRSRQPSPKRTLALSAHGARWNPCRVAAILSIGLLLFLYCHSQYSSASTSNATVDLPAESSQVSDPLAIYNLALSTRNSHMAQTQTRATKYTTTSIPPLVHMIWLGPTTPPATAYRCRDEWQRKHPTWHVLFWDEPNATHVVRTHFAHLWPLYAALPKVVMRSDWLRYMLLSVFGGIYADVDACPLKPFDQWDMVKGQPDPAGVVVGVEMDTLRADWRTFANRAFQIASWTLVSVPGHPLWAMILHDSVTRVQRLYNPRTNQWWANVTDEVCESTGPAVVTDVTLQGYMARWGDTSGRALHGMQDARRFGDAVLLPITSFAPHAADMGAKGSWDVQAYVHHGFSGTWKGQWSHVSVQVRDGTG